MFVKGLLFGAGFVAGVGGLVTILFGLLVLMDWAAVVGSMRRQGYADYESKGSVHRELILHVVRATMSLETVLGLLQSVDWRSASTGSPEARRTSMIQ
jgi:hypothetical protein